MHTLRKDRFITEEDLLTDNGQEIIYAGNTLSEQVKARSLVDYINSKQHSKNLSTMDKRHLFGLFHSKLDESMVNDLLTS